MGLVASSAGGKHGAAGGGGAFMGLGVENLISVLQGPAAGRRAFRPQEQVLTIS